MPRGCPFRYPVQSLAKRLECLSRAMAYLIAGHGMGPSPRLPILLRQEYAYTDDVSPKIVTAHEVFL